MPLAVNSWASLVGFLTSIVIAPLLLPRYFTTRINSGLVLPCAPGSFSKEPAACAAPGCERTRPKAAKQNANRRRFMGHLLAPLRRSASAKDLHSVRQGLTFRGCNRSAAFLGQPW